MRDLPPNGTIMVGCPIGTPATFDGRAEDLESEPGSIVDDGPECFGPGRNRLQFGPLSDLFVKNGFDGLRVPGGHLIAQENLQHVLGFALDVDRFVIAGEGVAWHQAGSGTIEERSS